MYQLILSFLLTISVSLSSKVTFIPNTSFNMPQNFKNGKLPCSKQTVIFPETLMASVRIESGISISALILPVDGELIIENGFIEFGPKEDCKRDGKVFYLEKSVSSWNQPDVWSSPKFNEATPDAEKLPCFDDTVEFPVNSTFTLVLPDHPQVIRTLLMNGKRIGTYTFKDYINTQTDQTQQFIRNFNQDTGVFVANEYCKSLSGCPCQKKMLEIECSAKFCPMLTCIDPVQPIGHCCKICGGVIAFDIDQRFDLISFKDLVESVVESYGKEYLVYHIGRFSNKVQLVVVDKGEYSGMSAEVVNSIDYRMETHFTPLTQISGSPLSKSGYGGKIFISMFFLVTFGMGVIYLYYYKMPQIHFSVIDRGQPRMFTRFNRRTESVVSLARRDSAAPLAATSSTAFRNPLYDSIKSRVRVEEPVTNEQCESTNLKNV